MTSNVSLSELNRRALNPAQSVAVSACAGSGKTWLLVSRIIRLLLAGVEPAQILAITFTRKAAQEMASRLRQWLRTLASEDDATVRRFLAERALAEHEIEPLIKRARELFERVLIADPPLAITTFHSWFLHLLRHAPLEAGALGNVTLLEHTSGVLDEAWERLMSSCQRSPESAMAGAVQTLFAVYGLENTRQLLHNFVARRCEWWAYAGATEQAVDEALGRLRQAMLVDPKADVCAEVLGDAGFVGNIRELAELMSRNTPTDHASSKALSAALAMENAGQAVQVIASALLTVKGEVRVRKANKTQQKKLGVSGQERLLKLHALTAARVQDTLQALTDQASYRVNAAGFTAGVALLERFQSIKQERQVVDFADVEWLAYQLLTHSEHAVTIQFKLDSRYRHILLDEFQDTNPLQWLALRAWFDAARQAHEAPRLFIVGDPKQSIYRFRRAEPELFGAARDFVVGEGGIFLEQDESRRCARSVLDVVNRVFASEPAYAGFKAHQAHYPRLPGRVEVLGLARNDDAVTSVLEAPDALNLRNPLVQPLSVAEDRRREQEAQVLAERISAIVAAWKVIDDPHVPHRRPVCFGDIMLLVRRRTHLAIYERALRQAGIPYLTSRQGGLLDTLEAEDLSALLELLIAPFEDLKLAHVLRSPIFACTDEDLIAIAGAPGTTWWESLADCATVAKSPAIARAHRLLDQWRSRTDTQPVHDQLDRIYFEADLLRRYAAAVPPSMRVAVQANLHAFIQHALDTDAGRYPSLPRFVAELNDMRSAPAEEAPDEGIVGSHGNAVRILTVHGAKGLEAPVVWLLDTAAARATDKGYDALIDWRPAADTPQSFSLWSRIDEQSSMQRSLRVREEGRAQREDLNLLYVAMTRARQALIVSGCETRGTAGSWYSRVRNAVAELTGQDPGGQMVALVHGDELQTPLDRVSPAPSVQTTASMLDEAPSGSPDDEPTAAGVRRAASHGPGPTFGTAFHRVMERLALHPNESPEQLRRVLRLPRAGFDALWAQAQRMLGAPALARYFDAKQYRRALNEVTIIVASGELRRLDRVVEFDSEVCVLDYKSGSYAALAGTPLESEYREQVAGYCAALRQVYTGKVVRGELLFTDGSRLEV